MDESEGFVHYYMGCFGVLRPKTQTGWWFQIPSVSNRIWDGDTS